MKKAVLTIVFSLIVQFSFSQVIVGETDVNKLDINYVQLIGVNTSIFGKKIKVYIDYGQPAKFFADPIKNSEGKAMKFNSMVHALNFMRKNNWKYKNYTEAMFNGKIRYVYLLEKE